MSVKPSCNFFKNNVKLYAELNTQSHAWGVHTTPLNAKLLHSFAKTKMATNFSETLYYINLNRRQTYIKHNRKA